jgi:hypothetical protein
MKSYFCFESNMFFKNKSFIFKTVIPGLRSESMIVELVQRLVRLPQLCTEVPTLIGFIITKDGKSVSTWSKNLIHSFRFKIDKL